MPQAAPVQVVNFDCNDREYSLTISCPWASEDFQISNYLKVMQTFKAPDRSFVSSILFLKLHLIKKKLFIVEVHLAAVASL